MRNAASWRLAAAALVLVLLLPLAAAAQQAGLTTAVPVPAQETGPVRQLTVDEAVRLALEQNLGVQVARVNPQIQDLAIAQVRGNWVPTLTSSLSTASQNSPVSNIFAGATTKLTNDRVAATVGLSQRLPTGGAYEIAWDGSRLKSNNIFSTRNPTLGSGFTLSFTQPLLRNFRIDTLRQQLQVGQKERQIADIQLEQTVINTSRNVQNAYWALSYAVSSLEVQRQSLQLAQESLRNNRSRVEIGTMAPIDIIEAQAEVAAREENVILAEASVSRAEDQLRALVFDPRMPDFWTTRIELSESPAFQPRVIDAEAAVKRALENRTDMLQARRVLESTDINLKYFGNQVLPDVNIQAQYGAAAQGGTEYDVSGYPDPIITLKNQTGYGSVLRSMLGQDFPTWSVGVQVGYPIGRSSTEAAIARTRLQREQQETQIRNLELQVATQVRDLARQVNTNVKRVEATRAARELSERRLEAEQKKLAAGMSTSFVVFQAQRDLAQARNAELSAILDYTRSLVDFEAGQEAPLGGGGVSISSGTATGGGGNTGG